MRPDTLDGSRASRAALDEHLAAVAAMDLGLIKAGYAGDAVLRVPDGEVRGRQAIGRWFAQRGEFFNSVRFRPERIETCEGFVAIEW